MKIVSNLPDSPGRRVFLRASAAVGGGMLLSIAFGAPATASNAGGTLSFSPSAFIRIDGDGQICLVMPKVEMGQGTYTALPMLIAEELEIPLASVILQHAPPDDGRFGDPMLGGQATGASNSIRHLWVPLRQAGATARIMLVRAAAQDWGVGESECLARNGVVVHRKSGRSSRYGKLVAAAARLPVPQDVPLKASTEFRLIGRPVKRLDSREKTDGSARFGIDATLPGLSFASVSACPVRGGRLVSVDAAPALAQAGVRQVIKLLNAVAVIATHGYGARAGLAALQPVWDAGANAQLDSAAIDRNIARASSTCAPVVVMDQWTMQADLRCDDEPIGAARIDARYDMPFLAHAPMEPVNCTVRIGDGVCDIWVGTQVPTRVQRAAAQVLSIPPSNVTVHNHLLGGGFGRRLDVDFVVQAVEIARQSASPVKVVWSREEDIGQDLLRPRYLDQLSAMLGDDGMPLRWRHRITGSSVVARWLPQAYKAGVDPDAVNGALAPPYTLGEKRVEYVRFEIPHVDTAFWRGVGATHNGFVVESFVDELSFAARRDPLEYRSALARQFPRALAVLEQVARQSNWRERQRDGRMLGVSLVNAFGSYIATVAEVQKNGEGVQVRKVYAAVDCGIAVNPDGVDAQIRGGILFGLSAALYGKITFRGGRVEQSNFHDYRVVRINESPVIDVNVLPSVDAPGGVGELGTTGIAPALANAIFAATGRRVRSLPLIDSLFV